MRRVGRKFATVAVLGLLAVGGLSACRSDAGTAAWVGNHRITQAEVSSITSKAKLPVSAEPITLESLVFSEVAARYAAAHNIKAQPVPEALLQSIATGYSVDEHSEFAQNFATAYMWNQTLMSAAKPTTPTDAQIADVYDRAVKAGAAPAGQLADSAAAIKSSVNVGQSITVQQELSQAVKDYNVSINPRYNGACSSAPCDALYYPVLNLQNPQTGGEFTVVILPLDPAASAPAVLDSPTPAPVQQ